MAKFRYYIADVFFGQVLGTNDEEHAKSAAESEECFVVDSETGKWLHISGAELDIKDVYTQGEISNEP